MHFKNECQLSGFTRLKLLDGHCNAQKLKFRFWNYSKTQQSAVYTYLFELKEGGGAI